MYELDSICDFDLLSDFYYDIAKKPDGYYLQIVNRKSQNKSYMNYGTLVESIKII